jgi:hypothetical protein
MLFPSERKPPSSSQLLLRRRQKISGVDAVTTNDFSSLLGEVLVKE